MPILVYAIGQPVQLATTTSLAIVGANALVGVVGHARSGNVLPKTGLAFGAAGFLGALAGTWLNRRVPGQLLLALFVVVMLAAAAAMLRKRGGGATEDEAHGVVVQSTAAFDAAVVAEYVAKHGQEPTRQRWSAAHELTKAHVKRGKPGRLTPWDFLRRFIEAQTPKARSGWAARWREYLAAFRGMAQLRWSRKLRERLGLEVERSDAEVAAERAEDGVLLALLYLDEWRCIWQADKVADLLDAAASGDKAAVWAVVAAAMAGKRAGP